ncbi:hypothetical protein B0H13DRAFT_1604979 [Mycena leptocephala]|nr:hypothetical protein B0H13DRAFT_1604979 [Mycena leptocephala]
MAGASRTELLQWLNEQCGAGGAYLQVLDSIYYGDIPMARAKMQARLEGPTQLCPTFHPCIPARLHSCVVA